MSRPPKKAIEQIKAYCEKTQCRRCVYGETERSFSDGTDFVGCKLQRACPCDWETEDEQ